MSSYNQKKKYKSLMIQPALNICPNCNYLQKIICIRVKTKIKKWGERKDFHYSVG